MKITPEQRAALQERMAKARAAKANKRMPEKIMPKEHKVIGINF
jgi:Spy/CpxP family protein refolding chaperone